MKKILGAIVTALVLFIIVSEIIGFDIVAAVETIFGMEENGNGSVVGDGVDDVDDGVDNNENIPILGGFTIQYAHSEGTERLNVQNGALYSIPVIPKKDGYDFLGLYDSNNGGTQFVNSLGGGISPFTDNKNLVLFPRFSPKEYTLHLDFQGAVVQEGRSIKVMYDSAFELPTNLKIDNKIFKGWYTEKQGKGKQIGDEYGVLLSCENLNNVWFDISNDSLKLFAYFEWKKYLVTLYPDKNGEPIEIYVEHGTSVNDIVCDVKVEGKVVSAWTKNSESGDKFDGKIVDETILYGLEYQIVP